jgi:hypothetical protein
MNTLEEGNNKMETIMSTQDTTTAGARTHLDERNAEILNNRIAALDQINGPRVGDFVLMLDGTLRRFTHDWGEDIQTTLFGQEDWQRCQSFYLGEGYVNYSGGLDSAIRKDHLHLTGTKKGNFWFFKDDIWGAGRGISVSAPCRIYHQSKDTTP